MSQQKLFEHVEPEIPKLEPTKPKKTCKQCKYYFVHDFTPKLKYCSAKKQKGTSYGKLKVKARQASCELFDKKEPK